MDLNSRIEVDLLLEGNVTGHELYREDGKNYRSVSAHLSDERFSIETIDMGPAPEMFWGSDDYEFWTRVPKDAWGELLMAIAREFLSDDAGATERLRDICRKHGVAHEWGSWP